MSLIDEALKRARMEAAKKAAAEQGLPYPAIPRHLGDRPRRTGWAALAAAVVAIAAGVAAGLFLAGSRQPPERPVTARTPAAQPAEPAPRPAEPAVSPRALEQPPAEAAAPAPEVRPAEPTAAAPAESAPATAAPPPVPASGPAGTEPAGARAAPAPPVSEASGQSVGIVTDPESGVLPSLPPEPAPAAGAEPAERFIGGFTTPEGATIELGGIAWSDTEPYALISGRVVGVGGSVEGFTVERISRRYVDLRGAGRVVRVSLQ